METKVVRKNICDAISVFNLYLNNCSQAIRGLSSLIFF